MSQVSLCDGDLGDSVLQRYIDRCLLGADVAMVLLERLCGRPATAAITLSPRKAHPGI
jgi:hypothetical protein